MKGFEAMVKQPLLNTFVNNVSMDEAINEIDSFIIKKESSYVVPVNVDVIVKAEKDEYLKKIINQATLTLVDGQPLVWISKIHRRPVKEKVSGSDMVPRLCELASNKGYSIFIIGGKERVAERAKENLEEKYKAIKIVGTYSPPIGFESDEDELEKINRIVSAVRPDILIVCFGCPKQEKWIYENYKNYGACVSICAGATVDFLAGNKKRAPRWMSRFGLEWLYRTIQEPKRLFRRYFVDDLRILKMVFNIGSTNEDSN